MEIYKRETQDILRRFLLHELRPANCIAAMDAAAAAFLLRMQPQQLDQAKALLQANNRAVNEELARRRREAGNAPEVSH